jgi:hypothetical protein
MGEKGGISRKTVTIVARFDKGKEQETKLKGKIIRVETPCKTYVSKVW